jgi:hypothetical protein
MYRGTIAGLGQQEANRPSTRTPRLRNARGPTRAASVERIDGVP